MVRYSMRGMWYGIIIWYNCMVRYVWKMYGMIEYDMVRYVMLCMQCGTVWYGTLWTRQKADNKLLS